MSTVNVSEFSHDPGAIFARAERGETIEITRHGKVMATLIPGQPKPSGPLELLVATCSLRRFGKIPDDLESSIRIDVPDDDHPTSIREPGDEHRHAHCVASFSRCEDQRSVEHCEDEILATASAFFASVELDRRLR